MIRLLLRLLNIRDFETCQSCETLKQQLAFANAEKKELTDTLLQIIHPKVVEAPLIELNPIQQTSAIFSRRRAALEAKDREEAKILREGKNIGKPDNLTSISNTSSINNLEQELGISEEKTN